MLRVIGNDESLPRQEHAIASGTLTNGTAVVINADGTVSVVSGNDDAAGTPTEISSESNLSQAQAIYDPDTGKVVVVYNENVNVTNGATLTVTATGGSNPTATAAAQTGVNKAEFTFTVPSRTHTLSIGAQTISGTIVDATGGAASDKGIVAGDVIDAGGAGDGGTETISVA